ncbi:MAG: hypothetical protein AAFY24_21540, partial [Pseudomonadota bacterium]
HADNRCRAGAERLRHPGDGVTPVVGGEAVKGPTAAMMKGFGLEVTAAAAASIHADLFDGYVIDSRDADQLPEFERIGPGLAAASHDTMMVDLEAKASLARAVLAFADKLGRA